MEQRWGFLAPWCDALKSIVAYSGSECSGSPFMKRSLCVSLRTRWSIANEAQDVDPRLREEMFLNQFQKTREAMALLAAVAHVDYGAWRYLLEKHCSVNFGLEGEAAYEEKIPIRYVVTLDQQPQTETSREFHDTEMHEYDAVLFFGPRQRLHLSAEYRETLQQIAALDQDPQRINSGFDFEVPVRVEFAPSDDSECTEELAEAGIAEKILKEQWDDYFLSGENQAPAPGEWRCTFVLERMITNLNGYDLSDETGPTIKALLRQNTWLSWLSLCFGDGGIPSVESCGQLISSVFGSTRRSLETANSRYHPAFDSPGDDNTCPLQLGEIGINWISGLRVSFVGAMCSAMVHSQMSKKLSMRLWMDTHDQESNQTRWKWLAYALFSKRARACSSVESLAFMIICSVSVSDMTAFTSILTSEHPEEDLFGSPPGLVKARDATLRRDSLIRCVQDGLANTRTITFDAPVPFIRTFSDDGKSTWVDSIVPGYGRCRVQRRDLVFDDAISSKDNTVARGGGITSLRLRFYKELPSVSDGLVLFFGAIGSSLERLTLDAPGEEVSSILQCCPNLEEFALSGGVVDARLDFTDYHARGESLPELRLNWESISEIAAALADNDNPLAKCARRIRARVKHFSDEVEEPVGLSDHERGVLADFDALLSMLEANKYLEYLEVVAHPVYDRYLPIFRSHHLKPIWRTLRPVSLGSKLALLSVCMPSYNGSDEIKKLRRTPGQTGATLMEPLNQHVLTHIFGYAAEPVLREVYFRKSNRIKYELIFDDALV